jgi:cytochrome P450
MTLGPKATAVFGWRGNMVRFLVDPIAYMMRLYREFGGVAALSAGDNANLIFRRPELAASKRSYFAFSPEANHDLLTDTYIFAGGAFTGPDTPAFRNLSSNHIFAAFGDRHKKQRRLIMPAFHKKRVEDYRDDMVRFTEAMLAEWKAGEVRDVWRDMTRLTLQIANKTLFGLEPKDNARSIGEMITQYLNLSISPLTRIAVNAPFMPYGKLARLADRLDAAIRGVIADRRAAGSESADMLAMMLYAVDEEGAHLEEDELIAHTTTLFIAGHETSSNGLSWTLFLLAQHPEILAPLVDELQGVLRGAAPSLEQLGQLPLLDAVIKESLRMFPPASMLGRVALSDTTLAGHPVPAGSEIFYSPYVTHRIPELYQDADRFMPRRWETLTRTPYEYLPFSAGPRMCIGATFATLEMKIVLAMLLQRHGLESVAGSEINRNLVVTMSPKPGLPMRVRASGLEVKRQPVRGNVRDMVNL